MSKPFLAMVATFRKRLKSRILVPFFMVFWFFVRNEHVSASDLGIRRKMLIHADLVVKGKVCMSSNWVISPSITLILLE